LKGVAFGSGRWKGLDRTLGHLASERYDAPIAIAPYKEPQLEPLSILNPPITDILNDPRVTSESLLKLIDEQQQTITQQLKDLSVQVNREDATPLDVMTFACLQHHLHVTVLNTKLTARTVDLTYGILQLNHTLEKLTKWLIGLTAVLGVLSVPLVIDVIAKWLK
jgi:hypothetical protein